MSARVETPERDATPAGWPREPRNLRQFLGPFADLTRRSGGQPGRHASVYVTPGQHLGALVARGLAFPIAVATVTWLILMVRQLPCRRGSLDQSVSTFEMMCYSDIGVLYQTRGQQDGLSLYGDIDWEYPVLSGYFAEFARRLTDFIGFVARPGLDAQQQLTNANVYFAVNVVMLFVCFLVVVACQRELMGRHPAAVLAVAAAPVVMAAGVINWDFFAIALTSLGLVAYSRRSYHLTGLWLGLAIAAKFYPLVIVGGLFALALRPLVQSVLSRDAQKPSLAEARRALFDFGRLAVTAAGVWLAVNLPVMLYSWDRWKHFYVFNEGRPADLGSPWYALNRIGIETPNAQHWALGIMVVGYAAIALVTVLAPVTPRVGQIAFLCVALMVSLNTVYSPQYVLWTLPLIVLARPVWQDLTAFYLAELFYFVCCWMYLNNKEWIYLGDLGGQAVVYSLSIFIRIVVTWWIMAVTFRDMWQPRLDPSVAERPLTPALRARYGIWADGGLAPRPTGGTPAAPLGAPVATATGRLPARPLFAAQNAAKVAVTGFLLSRALLLGAAVIASRTSGMSGLEATLRWDAVLFADMAEVGYTLEPGKNYAAFFPGLPYLMRILHWTGLSYATTGVIIAVSCSAVAAWGLYRLGRGGVTGAVAVLAWSFSPVAVFSVSPYTEAPFLALAVWAWLMGKRDRWLEAAVFCAGACLFRISGLFLLGGLALLTVFGYGKPRLATLNWRQIGGRLKYLAIPVAVLFAWSGFLKLHYGSWFEWFRAQKEGWPREFHWPWQALQTTIDAVKAHNIDSWIFAAEIVAVAIGLAVTLVCLFRWQIAEAGWLGVSVGAFVFQTWFMSVARNGLLWFPVYTLVGDIAGARLRGAAWWIRFWLLGLLLVASAAVMVIWGLRFYHGAWSG